MLLFPAVFLLKARLPPRPFQGWQSLVDLDGLRDIRYVIFIIGSCFIALSGEVRTYSPRHTSTHNLLAADSPLVFAQEFAITQGYSQSIITYIIAIANAGGLVGHVFFGLMADMFGPYVYSLFILLLSLDIRFLASTFLAPEWVSLPPS